MVVWGLGRLLRVGKSCLRDRGGDVSQCICLDRNVVCQELLFYV